MQTKDLFNAIFAAAAQDSTLIAWAAGAFANPLKFYRGLPSELFPNMDDDTPFVVFGDPYARRAAESRDIEFGFECWMGLSSSTYTDPGTDETTAPEGSDLIMDGIALLRAAVHGALPNNVVIRQVEEYHDTMGSGSEAHGFLAFELAQHLRIGIGQTPMS